ncbi:putative PAS domain sensory protein FXL5 [Paratrimastix pyriformis]|uniref:PAS domain sensory protein FXL5 n=1 Tax=Paratrimastix pyriformis TaxID=342808 RepID=A0ABQ8UQ74_9EUKA|nr:putative PAS domain sensory protein FXL5 [Paratrimastix pyriformis]
MSKDRPEGFKKFHFAMVVLQFVQMLAISFNGIEWPLGVTEPYVRGVFGVADLNIVATNQIALYAVFGLVCFFVIGAVVDAFIVAFFFHKNHSMPLLPIKILRVLVTSMVTFLYMPCAGILLDILDCTYPATGVPTHALLENVQCWGMPHLVPSVLAIPVLLLFAPFCLFTALFLFNNDPKKGGIMARPNGRFDLLVLLVKLIVLATSRLLTGAQASRAAVSIVGFLLLALWVFWRQPYIRPAANALMTALYACCGLSCIFSTVAPLVRPADGAATAGFWVAYLLILPALSTLAALAARWRARRLWALGPGGRLPAHFARWSQQQPQAVGNPPVSTRQQRPHAKQRASHRTVRAEQLVPAAPRGKQYRKQASYVLYADYLYNEAFRKLRSSPALHLSYAIFLLAYRKNSARCMQQLQQARQCYPSMDERFVIYVKSKDWEQQTSAGGDLRSAHVMSVFTFKRHFSMAQKYHEAAKAGLRDLCEVMLAPVVDQPRIPQLTATIVDSEAKAREYYELLLESHSNSVQVLRAYGSLLRDIYHDEDSARILFARADLLEDDASNSDVSSSRGSSSQVVGSALQQLHRRRKEAKNRERRKKRRTDGEIKLATRKENLLPHFVLVLTGLHVICLGAVILSYCIATASTNAMSVTVAGLNDMLQMESLCARMAVDAKVRGRPPEEIHGARRSCGLWAGGRAARFAGLPILAAHHAALVEANATLAADGGGSPLAGTVLPSVAATRAALTQTAAAMRALQTSVYTAALQSEIHSHFERNSLNVTELVVGDGANLVQTSRHSTLRGLLDRFAEVALDLATRPLGSDVFHEDAQFLGANHAPVLLEALKGVGFAYGDYLYGLVMSVEVCILVLTDMSAAVVLFCILTFFLRTSVKLGRDRELALRQVLTLSKTVIRGMLDALTAEQLDEAPRVRAAIAESPIPQMPPARDRPGAEGAACSPSPSVSPAPPEGMMVPVSRANSSLDGSVVVCLTASAPLVRPRSSRPGVSGATVLSSTIPCPSPPTPGTGGPQPLPLVPMAAAAAAEGDASRAGGAPSVQQQSSSSESPAPRVLERPQSEWMPPVTAAEGPGTLDRTPTAVSAPLPLSAQESLRSLERLAESISDGDGGGDTLAEWLAVTHQDATAPAPLPGSAMLAAPLGVPDDEPPAATQSGNPAALVPAPSPPPANRTTSNGSLLAAGLPGLLKCETVAILSPSPSAATVRLEYPGEGPMALCSKAAGADGAAGDMTAATFEERPSPGCDTTSASYLAPRPPAGEGAGEGAGDGDGAGAEEVRVTLKRTQSIPLGVWCRIAWGVSIMLVALACSAIFSRNALHGMAAIGPPLALCGQQQAQAVVLRLLATQLLFNSSLPLLDNPANPAATSPVWRDLSHLSNDRVALQRLLAGQADYLERLGFVLLYGTDSGVATADRAVDGRAFGRSSGRYAARERLLDGTQGCLMRNASDCVAGRIRGLDETLVGLSPLLARYLGAARKLSALPPERLRPGNPYFEFLFTAGMWDLGDGMQSWTESFLDESNETLQTSHSMLLSWFIIDIISIGFAFAVLLAPTKPLLWDVAHKTKKMLELFPEDASGRRLLGREQVVEGLTGSLLGSMAAHFEAEERLMAEQRFPLRLAHTREHSATLAKLSRALGQWDMRAAEWHLKGWLTGHVAQTDRALALFLNQRGVQ